MVQVLVVLFAQRWWFSSELWKIGQLKAGDKVKFVPISYEQAAELNQKYQHSVN
jgi:allophanate hydrolase subunit 2